MMTDASYTAFYGHRRIARGPLHAVALVIKRALETGAVGAVLLFEDATGRQADLDTRGSDEEVMTRVMQLARIPDATGAGIDAGTPRGRGRPKLGVVAREVTLLPRHWEWLATQPGGASVALRKLVDEARRARAETDRRRNAQERAYHFMSAIAGDMAGFEEAARALFAADEPHFRKLVAAWPRDVRDHAVTLAFGESPT